MIKLNKNYQKEIFHNLIKNYKGSVNASKVLKIPASSIRGYKNFYMNSIPSRLLNRLIELRVTSKLEIGKNTIASFYKQDQINSSLNNGREKRKLKIESYKGAIPKLSELISENTLNFQKWFEKYIFLLNSGFRKSSFCVDELFVNVEYYNFSRDSIKKFNVKIPRKFKLDTDFSYFFGLWCGDRAGGKRFGICNKNPKIIEFTEEFLSKYSQKLERILYISELINEPKISYDKKFVIKTTTKGWVLSVHSYNGILASFFYYLYNNLEEFLQKIDNPSFFAGLFDAEGNVSLYNRSFRIACKNMRNIEIYKKYLKFLKLNCNYDGNCLIIYNLKQFADTIMPYMKHEEKVELANFLCFGKGIIPEDYDRVLKYIKNHPNLTSKDIAKALNKPKIYSELRLLEKFNFIRHEGYPFRYEFNNLGDIKL